VRRRSLNLVSNKSWSDVARVPLLACPAVLRRTDEPLPKVHRAHTTLPPPRLAIITSPGATVLRQCDFQTQIHAHYHTVRREPACRSKSSKLGCHCWPAVTVSKQTLPAVLCRTYDSIPKSHRAGTTLQPPLDTWLTNPCLSNLDRQPTQSKQATTKTPPPLPTPATKWRHTIAVGANPRTKSYPRL
jgi:hypothetical protein